MKFYDSTPAPNPYVVRIFMLERGGLDLEVEQVDIINLENRRLAYRTQVNPRGELPALKLDDGTIITEITAICEYLDEVARGGKSLIGDTPAQRAETRMWVRRMDLEICQPVIEWWRNDPATIDFYKGNRLPTPEARVNQKVTINRFLNLMDDEFENKKFLCGDRFSMADIHFFGLMKMMLSADAGWVNSPGRKNVAAYFQRLEERESTKKALEVFPSHISI
ncbi:glutathione S-transferase [Corynespora cassiicola Philippines]|uniref:Glutathione S-transferase n=1 Tax=Corynespora cassiicola Philippines TaxID=1448308 RepID=A0A2T2N681_CORCC|nr:glutathione S-transferase [Corynespora cassiicola Philippines]